MARLLRGRINFPAKIHQYKIMNDAKRHRCAVLHRRAGKTVMAVYDGLAAMLSEPLPSPRVAYIAPFLKQAKKLAWDYLASAVKNAPDYFDVNQSELQVTFKPKDAKFMLLGADNIDAIRGMYFDHVIVDELADCDPRLIPSVVRPAIADRKGRMLLMGTPKGRMNMLYDLSQVPADDPDWAFYKYKWDETGMIGAGEIDALRREMSEALFAQEFECSFNAALLGSIYGKEMERLQTERRVTKVAYDDSYPVITAWDLGYADATAVWFIQEVGSDIRVIEYKEWTLTKLTDVIKQVLGRPYQYSYHIGPHDLRVHELTLGRTREDIARELGVEFHIAPKWPLEDGIEALRLILQFLWIDAENASHGLECLINYQFEFDDRKKSFKIAPLHDWTSHACDALRMYAVARDDLRGFSRGGQRWLL